METYKQKLRNTERNLEQKQNELKKVKENLKNAKIGYCVVLSLIILSYATLSTCSYLNYKHKVEVLDKEYTSSLYHLDTRTDAIAHVAKLQIRDSLISINNSISNQYAIAFKEYNKNTQKKVDSLAKSNWDIFLNKKMLELET